LSRVRACFRLVAAAVLVVVTGAGLVLAARLLSVTPENWIWI
jgi:hypothetical protein